MNHFGTRCLATAAAATLATLGVYATQEQERHEQVEQQSHGRHIVSSRTYIVRMAEEPVAKYRGRDARFRGTRPERGQKIDPDDPAVISYASYLDGTHDQAIARAGGGRKLYDYRYAVNGFSAELTPEQAVELSRAPGVVSVEPDVAVPLDTVTSPTFLGLTQVNGLWDQLGGVDNAGEDIILGIVDGGIWPEHPSFDDYTGENGRDDHWWDDDRGKGDHRREWGDDDDDRRGHDRDRVKKYKHLRGWRGKCERGEAFKTSDCNKKLIGARFFNAGRLANLPIPDYEYLSPRDYGGHGTHTASTAGGNSGIRIPASSGRMSGIAPRARIAVYKACFDDGAGTGTCFNSDTVAAIDQAVADGVDVINYSIGGTTTAFTNVVQVAFFNAAESGVFVAAAAGNSGPTAGTVAHPSPWVTTVAATTHPRSGTTTLTLGNHTTYPGASTAAATPSLQIVLSTAVGLPAGDNPATPDNEIALCFPGSLDPAKVRGRMVLCDRGVNARVDKSLAVAMAGGVAMILGNVVPGSLDPDFHSVPTIHVSEIDSAAIKSYVNATGKHAKGKIAAATLGIEGPPATIASFSSRGPVAAAGGDLLKPDVSAPGVAVMAGVAPPGNGGALFALYQGTSMASPHIAGVAALLRQAHPDWSPMAIKSAVMTTGGQMAGVNALPFNAGAGLVQPNSALDPGLVYDSEPAEWLAFVCGTGQIPVDNCTAAGVAPINPTDLNMPSIAVSRATDLPYQVTRRVTNVTPFPGTYTAALTSITGFNATVSPTSLSLGPGETKSYTVTFTRAGAPFDVYQFGALTWSDGAHSVRIPIAVRPVQLITSSAVIGSGPSGSLSFNAFAGYTGPYSAVPHGLVADTRATGTVPDDPNDSFDAANPMGEVGATFHDVVVPPGMRYLRFALFDDFTDGNDDLDLVVYRISGSSLALVGGTGGATSEEVLSIINPAGATYRVFVHGFATDGPDANYTLFHWAVPEPATNMSVSAPTAVTAGTNNTITVSWSGLMPGRKYLGTVTHHRLSAPVPPGSPRIGHTSVFIDVPAATLTSSPPQQQ